MAELDGMFAFALRDARQRRLLLARDRTGKKPLFYHDGPRLFAFASEVKALLSHPNVRHQRDPKALPLYLTYGYVPTYLLSELRARGSRWRSTVTAATRCSRAT